MNAVAYGNERIVLTRNGKPMAALVSLLVLESVSELEDRVDREAARKARLEARKHGTITLAELKSRIRSQR